MQENKTKIQQVGQALTIEPPATAADAKALLDSIRTRFPDALLIIFEELQLVEKDWDAIRYHHYVLSDQEDKPPFLHLSLGVGGWFLPHKLPPAAIRGTYQELAREMNGEGALQIARALSDYAANLIATSTSINAEEFSLEGALKTFIIESSSAYLKRKLASLAVAFAALTELSINDPAALEKEKEVIRIRRDLRENLEFFRDSSIEIIQAIEPITRIRPPVQRCLQLFTLYELWVSSLLSEANPGSPVQTVLLQLLCFYLKGKTVLLGDPAQSEVQLGCALQNSVLEIVQEGEEDRLMQELKDSNAFPELLQKKVFDQLKEQDALPERPYPGNCNPAWLEILKGD